jgi:hypothetical protein
MSELYTIASLKHQSGLAEHGRLTREEAIKRLRDMALHDKKDAEAILNASDEDFYVRVVRGVHVQHMVEVL